jgi:hypothetical protein
MTEPGWKKTKDPMYKCIPPKRWISAPMARTSGMGDRGFCEEPISEIPVVNPKKAVGLSTDVQAPCNNLSEIVGKYRKPVGVSRKCKHLRQLVQ